MTRNTTYLLGILATIILGTIFYLRLCSECQIVSSTNESPQEAAPIETAKTPTSYPFALKDLDYGFETQDNFNFNISSPSFLMPISGNVKNGVESLKSYLNINPDKTINITGYYTEEEKNNSAFPNLGIARANSVKNHLVSNGIPSSQINTNGELKDSMVPDGEIFKGPVSFTISEKDSESGEELAALYKKIKANPLALYFQTGEAAINLTAEQRQKVADLSKYLDKVEGSVCSIIGHTDNTGNRATNIGLGQERADFAKAYLVSNGIAEARITTSSQGPDNPIATNDTEEGRAKNRRTVVTLN